MVSRSQWGYWCQKSCRDSEDFGDQPLSRWHLPATAFIGYRVFLPTMVFKVPNFWLSRAVLTDVHGHDLTDTDRNKSLGLEES